MANGRGKRWRWRERMERVRKKALNRHYPGFVEPPINIHAMKQHKRVPLMHLKRKAGEKGTQFQTSTPNAHSITHISYQYVCIITTTGIHTIKEHDCNSAAIKERYPGKISSHLSTKCERDRTMLHHPLGCPQRCYSLYGILRGVSEELEEGAK